MSFTVTLIPGDGIGPEVVAAAVRVLSATGLTFDWETEPAGLGAIGEHGTPLPPRVVESVRRNKVALKGPTETPVAGGHRSVNVEMRQQLDLYANLRPVATLPGVPSRYSDVDLVVVRENTESLYSGLEHVVVPGVVSPSRSSPRRPRCGSPASPSPTPGATAASASPPSTRPTS